MPPEVQVLRVWNQSLQSAYVWYCILLHRTKTWALRTCLSWFSQVLFVQGKHLSNNLTCCEIPLFTLWQTNCKHTSYKIGINLFISFSIRTFLCSFKYLCTENVALTISCLFWPFKTSTPCLLIDVILQTRILMVQLERIGSYMNRY